jgi:hypothetical protein
MNNKKNVWLLPTDKPTGIFELNNGLHFSITNKVRHGVHKGYHIYITSDEEIKEGDYIFETDTNKVNIADKDYYINEFDFKIILTTDQDLIADGVQAIDDEFLEWFVKNPSCEKVNLKEEDYSQKCRECGEYVKRGYSCNRGCFMKSGNFIPTDKNIKYKIIIPKEEPKQHLDYINSNIEEFEGKLKEFKQEQKQYLIDMMRGDEELGLYNELYNEPKQETIEEVAKKYSEEFFNRDEISMRNSKASYIDGAKSDAARDYWYNKFLEDYQSQFKKQNNEQ